MTRPAPPTSTATIEALLEKSQRQALPLRMAFVQRGTPKHPRPGIVAEFVRHHDDRALELYLLLRAVASAAPWNVHLSSRVWARALDLGTSPSALSTVSKIWNRLEKRQLVARRRVGRLASVTVLREDGSGKPYDHPGAEGRREAYFKLPFEYWTTEDAWHRKLTLAETAMLLIGLSLTDDFSLPYEKARAWYGLSPDTADRGLRGLQERGLLVMRKEFKEAPLAPEGYTERRLYTLRAPFGPRADRRSVPSAGAA